MRHGYYHGGITPGRPFQRRFRVFIELHTLLHLCVEVNLSDKLSDKVDRVVDFFR